MRGVVPDAAEADFQKEAASAAVSDTKVDKSALELIDVTEPSRAPYPDRYGHGRSAEVHGISGHSVRSGRPFPCRLTARHEIMPTIKGVSAIQGDKRDGPDHGGRGPRCGCDRRE